MNRTFSTYNMFIKQIPLSRVNVYIRLMHLQFCDVRQRTVGAYNEVFIVRALYDRTL